MKYLDTVSLKTGRLFQNFNYKANCFVGQPMGRNTIGCIPMEVAKFLDLPDATSYTGHCFRRSSATELADGGVSMTTLKRQFRWKSSSVAESYIAQSKKNKIDVGNHLKFGECSSSSKENNNEKKTVSITNCSNVFIYF